MVLFLKSICGQRFSHAHRTMRGMVVFETAMEALMAHASIAMAVAWELSQRFGDFSGGVVGILCSSYEPLCRKRSL